LVGTDRMRKKKRGRPATGKGLQLQVRVHEPMLKAIDQWIGANPAARSRPDAIRTLVEVGLRAWQSKQPIKSQRPRSAL
jgi:hypothetical protein